MADDMYASSYSSEHYYMPSKTEEPKREKRKYRCRKRSPATVERARVVRRDKANARERRRMNSLNDALEHLRSILPQLPDEPKMTKIETLKVAQGYIKMLSEMVSNPNISDDHRTHYNPGIVPMESPSYYPHTYSNS